MVLGANLQIFRAFSFDLGHKQVKKTKTGKTQVLVLAPGLLINLKHRGAKTQRFCMLRVHRNAYPLTLSREVAEGAQTARPRFVLC